MNTPPSAGPSSLRHPHPTRGFTLVELLVALGVTGLLTSLLLPAVSTATGRAGSISCLHNLKQIQTCWLLYAQDHDDRLPPNLSSNVAGLWRSTADSWIGYSNAVHDRDTRPIEHGLLFRYDYQRNRQSYRCPADRSRVHSPRGEPPGPLRTRSYAMSGSVGGRQSERQTVAHRLDHLARPSSVFVLLDEHEDSIDDAHFLTWPAPDDRWVNLPANRHHQGANLTFADGHAEHWRWSAPKSFRDKVEYWREANGKQDLADLRRLQAATLAP